MRKKWTLIEFIIEILREREDQNNHLTQVQFSLAMKVRIRNTSVPRMNILHLFTCKYTRLGGKLAGMKV